MALKSCFTHFSWAALLLSTLIASVQAALSVSSTVLIFARDPTSAFYAYSGLQGYAIPYQVVVVPQAGITLPTLNSSSTQGNYGGIVVLGEVSYDFGGGNYQSALSNDQWQQLFDYQTAFGVRMVRLDVYPSPSLGCSPLGATSADQGISFTNTSGFPTANLKT
jgi:hypothetical protein